MYMRNYHGHQPQDLNSLVKYRKGRYHSLNGQDILIHIKYCCEKLPGCGSTEKC